MEIKRVNPLGAGQVTPSGDSRDTGKDQRSAANRGKKKSAKAADATFPSDLDTELSPNAEQPGEMTRQLIDCEKVIDLLSRQPAARANISAFKKAGSGAKISTISPKKKFDKAV